MLDKFFDYCSSLLNTVRLYESVKIDKAAAMIADAISHGKSFLIHDRGHLIGGELLGRAGGPAFVRKLELTLPDPSLTNPNTGVRKETRNKLNSAARIERQRRFEKEYLDYLFDVNGLSEGDVLLLNTNSGYGFSAIAIAQTAKEKGLSLIVISSKATMESVEPECGGEKISHYADILFDNHAPFGDAVFDVEGLDEKIWPASGMGAVYITWPLVLLTVEKLIEMGIKPTILRSLNIPGGPEQNQNAINRYEELGY